MIHRRYAVRLLLTLLLAAVTTPVAARTWHVAQDGAGDFAVIQNAVDAASDGDVIEIGPGRYEEYQEMEGSTTWDVHVLIPEGISLTFSGAGAGQTIIGPADVNSHDNITYGIATAGGNYLAVYNLSIENCNYSGIFQGAGSVDIVGCGFALPDGPWASVGLEGGLSGGGSIRQCTFVGFERGVRTVNSGGANIEFEDCEFRQCRTGIYAYTSGSANVHVTGSRFECELTGIAYLDFAGGSVTSCQFTNCLLNLSGSGPVTIRDSAVIRDDGNDGIYNNALYLNNFGPVDIQDSIFESNGVVVRCLSLGQGTIRDNHFIRTGDDYWIYSPSSSNNGIEVDFSLNYWGTTDIAELEAGIWDCHDDPTSYNCVIFQPIADAPVQVESHSWSGVKALFRGDRR